MDIMLRRRIMLSNEGSLSPVSPVFFNKLIFDGVAYIQTDLFVPINGSFAFKSVGLENPHEICGIIVSTNDNNNIRTGVYISNITSTNRTFEWRYASSTSQRIYSMTYEGVPSVNIWLTPYKAGAGNNATNITVGNEYPTKPLAIGGGGEFHKFTGKCGKLLIYGQDAKDAQTYSELIANTPLYTLQPCMYCNLAGMWCNELQKFYGNSAESGLLTVE